MSMLMKRSDSEENAAMPFWRLILCTLGDVSNVLNLMIAVMLGWCFYKETGSAVAAGIYAVIMIAAIVFLTKSFSKTIKKTNGKFGRCRPFMVIGAVFMLVSGVILSATGKLPESAALRVAFAAIFSLIFVIGFSLQVAAVFAGRGCLPDAKTSKAIFSVSEVMLIAAACVGAWFAMQAFLGRAESNGVWAFYIAMWNCLSWSALAAMVLAVVGISQRDRYSFYR